MKGNEVLARAKWETPRGEGGLKHRQGRRGLTLHLGWEHMRTRKDKPKTILSVERVGEQVAGIRIRYRFFLVDLGLAGE